MTELPISQPEDDVKSIATFLERQTHLRFEVFNAGDTTSPAYFEVRNHVAHDFRAYVNNLSREGLTFDELMEHLSRFLENDPKACFQPTSVVANVDEGKKEAVVYTQAVMYAWQSESEIKSFAMHSWRLERDGVWRVWQFQAMRSGEMDDWTWG